MTFLFVLQTILEIAGAAFLIWGIFNEQKLVRFEEKIKCYFLRRNFKVVDGDNRFNKHCA